jgi:hypothetical protein
MTFREIDLALRAQENPDYAFRYPKQFARQKPFFLFFVIHPWLSGSLHQNFIGSVDTFTRSFAYRTFTHFRADHRAVFDITMGEASRLLSGIVFINAWTGQPPSPPPQYRCFLNPFAKNKPAAIIHPDIHCPLWGGDGDRRIRKRGPDRPDRLGMNHGMILPPIFCTAPATTIPARNNIDAVQKIVPVQSLERARSTAAAAAAR